jgi:protease I
MALLFNLFKRVGSIPFISLNNLLMTLLSDLRVAVLVEDGVHQADVAGSREKLEKAGVRVFVVSFKPVEVKAWSGNNWGIRIRVDRRLSDISVEEFDGLIIPGGPLQSDRLCESNEALSLVRQFFSAGKILAVVGHGLRLLINAGVIAGRKVSPYPSLTKDIESAGGLIGTGGVTVDNGLITCRGEQDLEEFNTRLLEELRQGVHQRSETII